MDAVLLDVGGVLVMPSHRIVGGAATAHGGDPTATRLFRGHYLGIAAGETAGGFDWDRYRRALLAEAGVPADRLAEAAAALEAEMADPALVVWNTVLDGVAAGLEALTRTGLALGVVSNSDGSIAELLADLGLAQIGPGPGLALGALVDSAVVGVSKPDPAIFDHALRALGVEAGATAHVGDTPSADVAGAQAAGITPLHLDPVGWCRDAGHAHVRDLTEVADLVAGGT